MHTEQIWNERLKCTPGRFVSCQLGDYAHHVKKPDAV